MSGAQAYRDYLKQELGNDPCFISIYIQMEIRRSFLRNVIAFYSTLAQPQIQSVADAIAVWTDKFKQSELKAVLQLVGLLIDTNALDDSQGVDKEKALTVLGHYIARLELKLRKKFIDASKDTTHCTRALVPLNFYPDRMADGFDEFVRGFDDTDTCRAKCTIDNVLFRRYSSEVKRFIEVASKTKSSPETRGFIDIADQLQHILKTGPDACSCTRCAKIGDAVIALDAPRDMRLDHVDRSFNQLCELIDQPHKQYLSQAAAIKQLS